MGMKKILIEDDVIYLTYLDHSMDYDIWQNSLDENNKRFVPDEVFETLEITHEVVEDLIQAYDNEDGPFVYPVFRISDNKNLGYVQLVKIEEGFEIGYHIAQKYNGQGYATRAVTLFLQYLKNNTNIKEIYGVALADNLASIKVLTKTGFKFYFEGMGLYQGQNRKIVKAIKRLEN